MYIYYRTRKRFQHTLLKYHHPPPNHHSLSSFPIYIYIYIYIYYIYVLYIYIIYIYGYIYYIYNICNTYSVFKIYIYRVYIISLPRYQDVPQQLLEPLQTDGNIPISTIKLTKTIQNKILNYRDTVQGISVMTYDKMSFINKTLSFDCKSSSSKFLIRNIQSLVTLVASLTINFKN